MRYKVTFKEDYMPHETTQYCDVRDENFDKSF